MKKLLIALALTLFALNTMALNRDIVITNVTLTPQGSPYVRGPVNVANGLTSVKLVFARKNWPVTGGEVIKITVECSTDGGNTWERLAAAGSPGGVILNPLGVEIPIFSVQATLPPGTGRKIRARTEVFATLDTDIFVDTE